ncbi:MAG: hypothetical protein IT169_12385 [Bryobacterales bacterium]|nr:hypothetical protein [Bryobacterales bacterium]
MSIPLPLRNGAKRLAAGVEVSAFGALSALALMTVLAGFSGMRWYRYGNLFSIGLYPTTIFDAGFGYWTLAGFSLAFLYFVFAGTLFALVFRARRRGIGPYFVGVAFSLVLFLVGDRLWWQSWSPFLVIYGDHSHLFWSHVVFGIALGWLPTRLDIREREPQENGAIPAASRLPEP